MSVFEKFKEKIDSHKNVQDVFTPSSPIKDPENLKGRDKEIEAILTTIISKGRHGLIFGDRGIGKSSLATASLNGALKSKIYNGTIIKVQCGESSTFEKIIKKALLEKSEDYASSKMEETVKTAGTAGIPKILSGERHVEIKKVIDKEKIDPQQAADAIKDLNAILLIDEFDVTSEEVKKSIAELIKHLSDNESKITIIIVGISNDGASLVAQHPSVTRCLDEVKLERVSSTDIKKIIDDGEGKLGITFNDDIKEKIIKISNGFPYFTHLLGLKCSEVSLSQEKMEVDESVFKEALELAVKSSEGSLIRDYELAIKSSRNNNYSKILLAAAKIKSSSFTTKEWIEKIEKETNILYNNQSMSNFIGRLMSVDKGGIIEKVSHGVYRIKDPRMASFIIMNEIN
ncbi:ATP-binding protein [Serratia sp. (in: enterobacteria)]|uniref:ATP-binding protein n=1 Tax=Serratia sp. (in: enterobacteria) TaxID=616 RepID=UPI0028A27EF6|nr:ATP-binding protein [Serratia sp. (in: enterobacteria)]